MSRDEIIEKLRDDANYYGAFGKQFMSTSDIKVLVDTPDLYGQVRGDDSNLLKGSYFHKRILEPESLEGAFTIINASTRTTKEYKNAVADASLDGVNNPYFLLQKEVDEMEILASKLESNDEFVDALQYQKQPFEVEEPSVGGILGITFKGKADRINRRRGFIADLKTSRSLESFRFNFKSYGYHAQAYVYSKLFGLPVRFYVIGKEDGRMGVYDVSDETLNLGERYVEWGIERYHLYYGENPLSEITQYYEQDTI